MDAETNWNDSTESINATAEHLPPTVTPYDPSLDSTIKLIGSWENLVSTSKPVLEGNQKWLTCEKANRLRKE